MNGEIHPRNFWEPSYLPSQKYFLHQGPHPITQGRLWKRVFDLSTDIFLIFCKKKKVLICCSRESFGEEVVLKLFRKKILGYITSFLSTNWKKKGVVIALFSAVLQFGTNFVCLFDCRGYRGRLGHFSYTLQYIYTFPHHIIALQGLQGSVKNLYDINMGECPSVPHSDIPT